MREGQVLNKEDCNYLDLTRFVGIYLVILGHLHFRYPYAFIVQIIFSFHMPLFFVISGLLHKPTNLSKKSIFKLVYSLIVPYLIYNGLCIVYICIDSGWGSVPREITRTLFATSNPTSDASWFLLALFWCKLFALLLKRPLHYFVLMIVALTFVFLLNYLGLENNFSNIFMLQRGILYFTYFVFGVYFKRILDLDISLQTKTIWGIILMGVNIYSALRWGAMDVPNFSRINFASFIIAPLSGSCALILLSQFFVKFFSCSFVKVISRGTMIIVGLHMFLIEPVFSSIFRGLNSPLRNIFLASTLLVCFYFIIKLTYNRFPILFGKLHKQ